MRTLVELWQLNKQVVLCLLVAILEAFCDFTHLGFLAARQGFVPLGLV